MIEQEKFKKEIRFYPAWDKRDADPSKNYGIHGVEIGFYLTGERGVIQFKVSTNWHLPHVQEEINQKPVNPEFPYLFHEPLPSDIGYHSPIPQYEGQEAITDSCDFLNGRKCYYDGSSLRAKDYFKVLCEGGDDALWEAMKEEYKIQLYREENPA